MQRCRPTPRKPDQVNGLPDVAHDGMDLVGIVVQCAMSWKARATAAPGGINGDQSVTRGPSEKTSRHSPALPIPLCRNTTGAPAPCSTIFTVPVRGVRDKAM